MAGLHLTKIAPEANQWRYYRLDVQPSLFGEWGLVREWGRIGSSGQERTDWFTRRDEAEAALAKLASQKARRGYKCMPQFRLKP
jgi:predicted DNA-binding WGR domain protein